MSHHVPPYEVVRHAQVASEPKPEELSFVIVGLWRHSHGRDEWCLEYIDAVHGSVRDDECFDAEGAAVSAAAGEFGLTQADWRDGYPGL